MWVCVYLHTASAVAKSRRRRRRRIVVAQLPDNPVYDPAPFERELYTHTPKSPLVVVARAAIIAMLIVVAGARRRRHYALYGPNVNTPKYQFTVRPLEAAL